ncbi:MAG TPA: hypothetical protein VGK20_04035 [Candidatus Binatia bacterium]
MRKKAEDMTDAELCTRIGIPADCPDDVLRAFTEARVADLTREGIQTVKAATPEQQSSSPERGEQARCLSLRGHHEA